MKRSAMNYTSVKATPKRQRQKLEPHHASEEQNDDDKSTAEIIPVVVNNNNNNVAVVQQQDTALVVTPGTNAQQLLTNGSNNTNNELVEKARRVLFPIDVDPTIPAVTPSRIATQAAITAITPSPTKRKLSFGRSIVPIEVKDSVKQVYNIVQKLTGSIGGNCSFGPIYGELTMGSMQKVVNTMKEYTHFDTSSTFIDVGSGIGKPNLHVMQDPGVAYSYGIEVEIDRWLLGMNCLKSVLNAVSEQQEQYPALEDNNQQRLQYNCIFDHGDITSAKSFDPFTHVYMFSIGFPPKLWTELSKMWNRSKVQQQSSYLICYHGPKQIIHKYNFHVDLIHQIPTQMHGSSEGHTCYIYQRTKVETMKSIDVKGHHHFVCDPYFEPSMNIVRQGFEEVYRYVTDKVNEHMESSTRRTRSQNKT